MKTYTSSMFSLVYVAIGSDDAVGQVAFLFQSLHSSIFSDGVGHERETTREIMRQARTTSMTDQELEIWVGLIINRFPVGS
jgi:hypothetical protein